MFQYTCGNQGYIITYKFSPVWVNSYCKYDYKKKPACNFVTSGVTAYT